MAEYGIPIKIRACDTMGYGVNYPGAVIPRSVQGIIYAIHTHAGVPHGLLEWHGHNDFYKAVVNATTAWLYGCSGVNTSLFGIGERTGNTPLEAMVFEYAQLHVRPVQYLRAGRDRALDQYPYGLTKDRQVRKGSELVAEVKAWVDQEYAQGCVTVMTDDEIETYVGRICAERGIALALE